MKRVFADLRWFAAVSVISTGASAFWGPLAVQGYAMGLFGTALHMAGIWGIVRLVGMSAPHEQTQKLGAALSAFMFLFKLPVMVALMMVVSKMGTLAQNSFLLGLGVVYCWAIGWAESVKD